MKNLLVLIIVLNCSIAVQAQVTDTLGWSNFMSSTETLYESPNGGYAFGNNGYNDKVKAQTFSDSVSYVLKEAWLKFGAVEFNSEDSTSSVMIYVYLNNGPGITQLSNSDTLAPDSIVSSREIPIYELTEGGITEVDFSSETLVFSAFQQFSIGISFDSLAVGDTIGLVSTTDGDAGGTQRAWELTANDNWIVISQPAYSWNLDVDLGIFAVTDRNDPASIHDITRVESLHVYPNPTSDMLNLNLDSFADSESIEILIADQIGQTVWLDYSDKRSFVNLDVSDFISGIYTIRVSSESRVTIAKFVKQ